MAKNTNLNVSPYFDDFDESKNYNKVLFKPGYPVQARELTTLQSILQNQVEKLGKYFFKEGSVVVPGGTTYDSKYTCVRIDPTHLTLPVNAYTKVLVDNNIKIKGETSGVTATVVNRLTATESIDNFDTLYIKYTGSGTDGTTRQFQDGENLITLSDIIYSSTKIEAEGTFAKCIETGATKIGSSASISDGLYFIRGSFVKVEKSTVILDQYTSLPSYKIGLVVNEKIISASSTNSDLYDNAQGFSNESAPGADRFSITAQLGKKLLTDPEDKNFLELIRINNGILSYFDPSTDPKFNLFEDALAKRTYEESGNYYVRPFTIDSRESLNDRISNRGLYFENQITQNTNTPSDDIFCLQMSPGKAYANGYRIVKDYTSAIDVKKPRTKKEQENVSIAINGGNILKVNNVYGTPRIGFTSSTEYSLDLLDRRIDRTGTSIKATGSEVIGRARVYDWSNVGLTTAANADLRLFDIQTYTKISVGIKFDTNTVFRDDVVEGKYSGATGHVVSSSANIGNTASLTLQDVRGQFTRNEPLLVNGNDVGRNVGVTTDYDVSDAKSVHSAVGINTFAADTELSRTKDIFNTGLVWQLKNNGEATCPGISDFRGVVKIGDILQYNTAGTDTVPIYNRVSAIDSAGKTLTLATVEDVDNICTGSLVAGTTEVTGVKIASSTLDGVNKAANIIPLENPYVSSVNVKDSSYIIRKLIYDQSTAAGVFEFNLDDLGDDDLYYEPFSKDRYYLSRASDWAGGGNATQLPGLRIDLESSQVEFSNNNRTITIKGLAAAALDYELTATLKRSTLSSKNKGISRCENLVISHSKLTGSGSGNTTLDDGLTADTGNNSKGYGRRVQDREICLNYPDIYRVLGIFESNDANAPDLPRITVSDASDVFTNNVIVGAQFVGNTSGALARVVAVPASGTQLDFVYENKKEFEIGELITLKESGIVATINLLMKGDSDISPNYELDSGQRADFIDYGRIVRKKGAPQPSRQIRIIFDRYTCDETTGSIQTVNSYNSLDYTREIPTILGTRASDVIDLRPRVTSPYSWSGNPGSPFTFGNRNFEGSQTETVVANQSIIIDYTHYLGRTDRLYLTNDGIFELKAGEPSINPKPPLKMDNGFEVAWISMNPYVLNASADVNYKMVPHKRYTMKDIGGLESRIKNLENYTTLSLLETDTKNLAIKDPNTGLDKFKSGFFVDNFRNHASHDFDGESNFDIDVKRSECRPRTTERNVALIYETTSSASNPLGSDYRYVSDFDTPNITRSGQALTLAYSEEIFINQPLATHVENLNPFSIAIYSGTLELTPSTDYWMDEIVSAPQNISFGDGIFEAISTIMGADDRENGGMTSGVYNSTDEIWNDVEFWGDEVTTDVSRTRIDREKQRGGNGVRFITTDEVTTTTTTESTWGQTGIEREFGLELSAHTENIDLGPKVTSTEILFNCRSRNVEVVGTRLKPNTKYYVFMENVDVTNWCVPKLLPITMNRGTFATQDIITTAGVASLVLGQPDITFRAAQINHKLGAFNNPTETYLTEPYSKTALTSSYSSTSNVLNVDTFDLSDFRRAERLGYVTKGMVLANKTGTAEAVVNELSLMSDESGNLIFSLHIPDPSNPSNPKFSTGLNTIRVTTSASNASILDPGESSAQTNYLASGTAQYSTEQTLSIKTPQLERKQIGTDQPISRITDTQITSESESVIVREVGAWHDPLAQSFVVSPTTFPDGIFVTGGELYFKSKDESDVTVQIRELDDTGRPSLTIVPFGQTKIIPADVSLSDDSSVGTGFAFPSPVYLQSGGRYALVLITPLMGWNTFITRMNEIDLISGRLNDKQPSLGSLFRSQNNELWTENQYDDLKFKLNKAKFVKNVPSSFIMYNNDLPKGEIRKLNPVTAYSKRQVLGLNATTNTTFDPGRRVVQTVGGVESVGRIFASGGPITTSGTTQVVAAEANSTCGGTGISPFIQGTYTGVTFTSLSGHGSGAIGEVIITAAGEVGNITITNGGTGYAKGDLLVSGTLDTTSNGVSGVGSGVRVVVEESITAIDTLVVDDVDVNITAAAVTYKGSGGDVALTVSSVSDDATVPYMTGFTMKVDHKNHGMHSTTNKVTIENFIGDYAPLTLSQKIDDNTTEITVNDGSILANFEGKAVANTNVGYVKIGKEIISYTARSGNVISGITREVENSLRSNHPQNEYVYKYEFNRVSLTKINKTHDMSNLERTFDSYYLTLSDTTKAFEKTKTGGGGDVKVSQNIPFEAITPKLNVVTPTNTNMSSRIKTTSGTSLSGSEVSFGDIGYENVSINKFNELNSPRLVASNINEYTTMNDQKSFALELVLNTTSEHVSPLLDLDTANVILHSNLVNNPISDWSTSNGPRISGEDPNSAIYETKRIDLEFPSNSLYVQFDGHKEISGEFRVFYKLFRNDSQDFQQNYLPFNINGLSDKIVNSNINKNGFSEYKFTAENLPQYSSFMIKVIMTSTDQAQAPRLKNFRAIALRSYNIE